MIKCQNFPGLCNCKEDCLQKEITVQRRNVGNYADCKKHSKEVLGCSDMKALAASVSDLHYEALVEFLYQLQGKLMTDATKDIIGGRTALGNALFGVADHVAKAWVASRDAWKISKPFMK